MSHFQFSTTANSEAAMATAMAESGWEGGLDIKHISLPAYMLTIFTFAILSLALK